jgi:indole-3-glycerol phosphate synthase
LIAKANQQQNAVIAEIKQQSPSKGLLRENFKPLEIAESYVKADATCLSILTDQNYFKGHNDYLTAVSSEFDIPIIRKDFIIDVHQVLEARCIKADAILLIAACLSDSQMQELAASAYEIGLDVLFEAHDLEEVERINQLKPKLLGVNNRNLKTFETSLNTSIELKDKAYSEALLITESGIHQSEDVKLMNDEGIFAFLVGEAFMRAEDPGEALGRLFNK